MEMGMCDRSVIEGREEGVGSREGFAIRRLSYIIICLRHLTKCYASFVASAAFVVMTVNYYKYLVSLVYYNICSVDNTSYVTSSQVSSIVMGMYPCFEINIGGGVGAALFISSTFISFHSSRNTVGQLLSILSLLNDLI